jgi:hypothetical protein
MEEMNCLYSNPRPDVCEKDCWGYPASVVEGAEGHFICMRKNLIS